MTTAPSRGAVLAIAGADLLDRVRAGVGSSIFVQPAILLLVLLMGVVAPSLSSVKLGEGERSVAVSRQAAADGPAGVLIADLQRQHPRFQLQPVDDVRDEVAAERADAGLLVEAAGGAPTVKVVVLPSRRASKVTAAELTGLLRQLQLARTAGASTVEVRRTALKDSAEAGRVSLGGLLPFLVAFQIVNLFADASIRLRGSKTDRSAEVMHVLPVSRLDLVLGRAVVGVGDGIVRLAAMMVIVAALPLVPQRLATFSVPATMLGVLAAAGLCQLLVATAGGSLVGAVVRTEAQEQAVQMTISLGLSVGFIGFIVASAGPLPWGVAAVPFVGPISWARNAFFGAAAPAEAVVAVAVSLVAAAVLLLLAARALERDGVTLRET